MGGFERRNLITRPSTPRAAWVAQPRDYAASGKSDLTQQHMSGDLLGLGNKQNVQDHNGIERALDPFGIF
jgi:hypothetical protein